MNFSVSGEADWEKGGGSGGATRDCSKMQFGFTRLPNGTFQWFDVESGQGKDTAQITVIAASEKMIWDALPRHEDKSVLSLRKVTFKMANMVLYGKKSKQIQIRMN